MIVPTIVKSQREFDAAVAAGDDWIRIDSPHGVWIGVVTPREVEVSASGSSSVSAYGSSSVSAYGSSTVSAYDSSTVRASGSSTVRAYDSSSVSAYGSSTVSAYDSSTVRASGSSTVCAYGSSSVCAYGSSSVSASGSSSVIACGSSTVSAYDSSTVRAYDSSTVSAYDSSTVRAASYVAVHLHSGRARIHGGVLIDHTDVDLTDLPTWLDYHGVTVTDGIATLYKAVDQDLHAGHGYTLTRYEIGSTVTADDWTPHARCGGGLHATGDPGLSETFYNGTGRCRYLELAVPVEGLVPLDDKVKFRSCTVVREVTISGAPVAAVTS